MKKVAMLLRMFMPAWLAGLFTPNREHYRNARIDVKAATVGGLANLVRGNGPPPSVAESRAQMAKMAGMLDRKGPELARVQDITLAGAEGPLRARLYSDHTGATQQSAFVFFHGGGFIQGDLDTHNELCAKLAKWWGGVVIAVDYRLAPEHPYPAGVDDCAAAYLDVVERADELGLDAGCIGVGGDSAGGCFAAVVSQKMRNEAGPLPRFQVLIYPVTDGHINSASVNDLKDAYILPKERMLWYRDMYAGEFNDFDDPKFSPLLADDFSGLPEAFIITGGFDPLVDDGAYYADKLRAAGVHVMHWHFSGQVHAFVNLTKFVPEGTRAIRDIANWLRNFG